jgi:type 1 glutamine amidotransferase
MLRADSPTSTVTRGAFGLALLLAAGAASAQAPGPVFRASPRRADALKVLLVTGGHDHDVSFYSVLGGHDDLDVNVDPYPNAFQNDIRKSTDVLVLYDMPSELLEKQQLNLRAFVEAGKGVVALHHAIAGRTTWKWWYEEVIGGRYLTQADEGQTASSYLHDVDLMVRPRGAHAITAGIGPFRIWDETYKGLWISPKVQVLLETDHPTSDGPVAWIGPIRPARVVYIQLGHGRDAHLNSAYRKLVRNAILWSGGRL